MCVRVRVSYIVSRDLGRKSQPRYTTRCESGVRNASRVPRRRDVVNNNIDVNSICFTDKSFLLKKNNDRSCTRGKTIKDILLDYGI